jgi:CHAT domain-containing protein
VAVCLDNLAHLLGQRGDLDGAEPLLREALAMFRKLYPPERYPAGHPQLARCLENLGMMLQQRGAAAQAVAPLAEALAMQQRLIDIFLGGVSEAEALNRLAALPPTRDSYLSVTGGRPGMETDVYRLIWQGKGVVARWLGQRRLGLLAAGDSQTRVLARDLTATRQALARQLLAPAPGSASAGQRRQLAERKEELEKQLARRLPAFARELEPTRRTPEELRRRLPTDTAFIDLIRYVHNEYFAVRGKTDLKSVPPGKASQRRTARYAAFVVCRGQEVKRVELGPAQIVDEALASWRRSFLDLGKGVELDRGPARGHESTAQALRQLVWEPLSGSLPAGIRVVYLAPDGALSQLPWAALPGRKPGAVLLEDIALAVVPHGQFLLEALTEAQPERWKSAEGVLLAIGGVRYDEVPPVQGERDVQGLRAPAALAGDPRWSYLPGSERELKRVAELAAKRKVIALRGAQASTGRLLADLPKARWVHLATHGFFADPKFRSVLQLAEADYTRGQSGERIGLGARNPLVLSGLVLAGADLVGKQAPKDGGILTAEAIAGLDLDGLELAVLSACDTGLGEVAGGEGVFGLQRAFHIAGAKNAVASLWKVDDEATAAVMSLFYHQLWVEKEAPIEALRQAQLTLLRHPERIAALARQRGPDFEKTARLPTASGAASARVAPVRLWAGFVLSGAGR